MTELRISRGAQHDLRDIMRFSKARFGVAVARAYLRGLHDVFVTLRERPLIGVARGDLGRGVRALSYRSHRIYDETEGGSVDILRVLHHARDVPTAVAPFP